MPASRHITAAAAATLLGLMGAAHATPDWQAAAATCVPDSRATVNNEVTGKPSAWVSLTNAAAEHPTSKVIYFCNVLSPDDPMATPTWNNFRLQFSNTMGTEVQAVLYSKNKMTGAFTTIASAVSFASAAVAVVTVPLPAAPLLDFVTNAYHIIITVTPSQGNTQPRAHMVILSDN